MENGKKWFWFLLDALIAVAIINVLFFVMPMLQKWGDGFYPARTLTVSAEGKTTASPDMAELTFSVVTQGQNPSVLTDNNNQKMTAVLKFVKSQGIDDKDITTTAYNLSPNYQWDKNTQRNYITGYTMTQTVQAKIRDLTKVADVIGGLAPLGVNQVSGVAFTFADPETVLAAARADAFAKALAKAKDMAASSGASLGGVVSVAENNYLPVPRTMYASDQSVLGMGGAVASAPTIQPGTQDITDTVNVVYSLR